MDFNPSKSLLIAGIAGLGAVLIYLAVTGRYRQVGAALGAIPVLPGNGLTIAGALTTAPGPSTGSDGGNVGLGGASGAAGTSAGTTAAGRAP